MSLADLFYAKQSRRSSSLLSPRRKRSLKRHPLLPRPRKVLFEPLEPRLMLSVMPGLEPVLFVPGFGGSIAADTSGTGFDEWLTTRGIAPGKLQLETLANSYHDLVQTLENVGYSVNKVEAGKTPVYIALWDWRVPVAPQDGTADGIIGGISAASISDTTYETGLDYLGWWIKEAADDWFEATGTPLTSVDMVTHSTGGLVARSYIQSSAYGLEGLPTVDDLVLSGVPSEGTADPWNMLQNDFDAKPASRVLGRVVDNAYDLLLSGHDILGPAGTTIQATTWVDNASTREAFIGQYVGALHDLLPTYPFLDTNDDGIYEPLIGGNANGLLLDLNGNVLDPDAFIDLTGSTTVIYSDEITTPTKAIQRFGPSITLEVLPFNEYIENRAASGEIWYEQVSVGNGGDGTVPTGSARPSWFDAANPKLSIQELAVGHSELVQDPDGQAGVLDAIGVTGYTSADISTGLAKTDVEKLQAIINLGLFEPDEMLAEAAADAADVVGALVDWGIDALAGAPHFTLNDGSTVVIEGTSFADHLILEDPDPGAPGRMRLRNLDDGTEALVFDNPSVSLTINLGGNALAFLLGGDALTLQSLDPAFAAALTINGGSGTGGTDVVIDTDVTLPGKTLSITGDTVTVNPDRMVSTAPSTGDSGAITFVAGTIDVRPGAKLLAHAVSAGAPGAIRLQAENPTPLSFPFPFVDIVNTAASITLDGATVKGGEVKITATADADRSWDELGPGFDLVIGFLDSLSEFGGVAISNATATIDLRGATAIAASSLTLESKANAEANVKTLGVALAVAYGEANPTAKVTIASGVEITTADDLTIKASADSVLDVAAKQSLLGAAKDTADVDVTIAVGVSTIESTAWVQRGSRLDVGGDLTIQALMTKSQDVSSSAGAYEDGAVGTAVALSWSSSVANAVLDGTADVEGSIAIEADSKTSKEDTSATAQVGTGIIGGLVLKAKDKVGLARQTGSFFQLVSPTPDQRSGATPFALSAAFAWADHTNQALARIDAGAHVTARTGELDVTASIRDLPEISARAFVDSQKLADANQGNTKETSVSTAIVVGNYRNYADAHLGRGAVVDAAQMITVHSETQIPLVIDWLQFDELSDLSEIANSNFGIQNGLFTSWAQSNASGTKTALAVSVDVVNLVNTSHAYIGEGAMVNQDPAFRTGLQDVRVEAFDLIEAMHLSGVFGLKFLGTQAGNNGVGGSYLEVDYENAITARILSGAHVYADSLIVRADAKTHNFALAEAGGAADNLAVNGAFSLVRVNDRTIAQIDDGAFVTLGSGLVAIPRVVRDRFQDARVGLGEVILPFVFGTETEVEDTLLALDTNGDVQVDASDKDIVAVDPHGPGRGDDVLRTNLNQLVVAENESTIINAGGGITKGQSFGVGFSISINEIDRETKALLGNRSTGFTPAGVDSDDDTITFDAPHGLVTGDTIVYDAGAGTPVGGLTDGQTYYVIVVDPRTVRLAATLADAFAATPVAVNLNATATPTNEEHALRDADGATGALAAAGRLKLAAVNHGEIFSYTISGAATTQQSTGTSLTSKDAPKGSGKYGIGVSVDVSVNTIRDVTETYVGDSEGSVNGATDLVLLALNPTVVQALSGSVAISTASGASGTLAGAWTQNTIHGTTRAFIEDSTIRLSGDLALLAETPARIAGNAASLSGAGKIGAAGSVTVNEIDIDTLAFVKDGSSVTVTTPTLSFDPAVAVNATTGNINLGYAHGLATGDQVVYRNGGGTNIGGLVNGGVYYVTVVNPTTVRLARSPEEAASAAATFFDPATDVNRRETAINLDASQGAAIVGPGDTLIVADHRLTTGDSIVYRSGGGTPIGGLVDGQTYYVIRLNDVSIKLADSIAEALAGDAITGLDFTVAGATTHFLVAQAADEILLGYDHRFATGDAVVYHAGAGDSAIGGLADGKTYYVIRLNDLSIKLADSIADALAGQAIEALDASQATGTAHSLGLAVDPTAAVGNTHILAPAGNVTITALNGAVVRAIAAAPSFGGKAGVGASVAVNTIEGTTKAFIDASDVSAVNDVAVRAETGAEITAGAAAIGASQGPAAAAVAVTVNTIRNETGATISGKKADGVHTAGDVVVDADDSSVIWSVAGNIAASTGAAGIGVSTAVNVVDNTTTAPIVGDAVVASSSGDVKVTASQQAGIPTSLFVQSIIGFLGLPEASTITALAIGGGGANKAGLFGSVAVNVVTNETRAHIGDRAEAYVAGMDPTVTAYRDVVVSADDDMVLFSLAGNVSLAGTGALGISSSTIVGTNVVEAWIGQNAAVFAGGYHDLPVTEAGLLVTAKSSEDVRNFAVGGAGAGEIGGAGSASVTVLNETTRAFIDQGARINQRAGASDDQSVDVRAEDKTTLLGIAGALAGGGTAGIGAGADVGVLTKLTEAFIAPSATVDAQSNVVVDAVSTEDVSSISASVGGGGSAGIAGAAGVYVMNIRTRAFIGPDTGDRLPGLSGSPTLTLADNGSASDTITITRSAGSWIADGFAVGRIITLSGSGPRDGTYQVAAVSDTELTLVPIYAPTIVTAEGSVVASAADDTELDVIAGNISGAGSASVGASGAVPILNKTTEAFIGRDAIVDTKGLRDGLDVATGRFTIGFEQESFSLTELPAPAFFAGGTLDLDVTGDGQADLNEESLSRQRTASAETRSIKGVAVTAINQDDVETLGLTAGGSGGVSVNVGGSVQVTTTGTSAFVDADARINTDDAGAGSKQSVLVAAGSDYSHVGLAAIAAGAGGVAVTPGADVTVVNGTTEAYVADGAEVRAEQDILVAAHAAEDILSLSAGVAGSGTVSVGGAVSVIVVNTETHAHICDHAATDAYGAIAHAGGNVLVAATDDTDIDVIAGSLGIGFGAAGVGGSVAVTVINKDTRAYVGEHATVDAGGNGGPLTGIFDGSLTDSGFSTEPTFHGLAVQAASSERVSSVAASGAGGFYAGVAGGVSVEVIDSDTVATIGANANVNTDAQNAGADQSVNISAVNDADVFVVAGGLGIGFVGVGGGVDVGVLRNDTSASIGAGAEVHASRDIDVNALSRKTVDSIAVSAAGGVIGGVGSVSVWAIGSPFDATYSVDGQSGNGLATTGSSGNSPQFANVSSFADAMAGGKDPGNPTGQPNNGYATILDGYDRFTFDPSADLDATADTIDLGPDHGLSTGDAVVYNNGDRESIGGLTDGQTYYVIVEETDPNQIRLADSVEHALNATGLDLTAPAVPASGHSLTPLVGNATSGAGDDVGDAAPQGAVTAATGSTEVSPGTIAFIGSGAVVTAGDDVKVRAKEDLDVLVLTGSAAVGAVGIGGSVTVVNVRSNTVAYIAGDDPSTQAVEAGATVSPGSDLGDDIALEAMLDGNVRGFAFAGQAGLVGLGAQVVVIHDTSAQAAFVQGGAEILKADTLGITAVGDRLVRANATGGNVGGVAAGASVAVVDVGGSTTAFLGGAEVGLAGAAVRNMGITADSSTTADVDSVAVAAGIVAGSGSVASATVDPTVQAFIGDGAQILVTDNILVEARSQGLVTADAGGIGLSGIGVGVSRAVATWNPTITAFVGASTSLIAGADISVLASSNHDEAGAADPTKLTRANATSSSGSLIGGVGAGATATTTANVSASIGNGSTLTAGHDVMIRSLSNNSTEAEASGKAFAIAGGGITTATSSITNVNHAYTGDNVSITAVGNFTLSAQSISRANKSDVTGGAGGILAGASTSAMAAVDDHTTVTVGDGSTITAGGILLVEALSSTDAHSKAGIQTAAAATFNLTKADTDVGSHTKTEVGTDATLIGNTVKLHAKVTKLDGDANAFSKTIAAASTTDAQSFADVKSHTQVIVHSGADITGTQRLEIISRQDGVDVDSDAVATIQAGLTGTVRATGHDDLDLDSDVDIQAGSRLVSDEVFVEAESPKTGATYGHTADADAQTIVQTVVETLRVVTKVVSKIPIIGWFVKWITKLVTVVSQVILQSNESAQLTGAFTSDNAINLAGDIIQGASSSPRLVINADGSFDAVGVTAEKVGNEVIVSDITGGQGAGSILLSSPGGTVSGNGTIHKNSNFAAVTIVNNSDLNLRINDISSINPNAIDADLQIESDPAKDTASFSVVSDLGSGMNSPLVRIQNNTTADVLFAGEVENPTGITTVTNQGGDILALPGAFLEGRQITLEALQGQIGEAANRLGLRLYTDESNATLTANAPKGGIYLDTRLLEIGETDTAVSSADIIDGADFTNVVAGGDIDVHAPQSQVLVPSGDPGGSPTLTNVSGIYNLHNVASNGGNVTIAVDSSDLNVGSVHSPLGAATLLASRSIHEAGEDSPADLVARDIVLTAATGEIGTLGNALEIDSGMGLVSASASQGVYLAETAGDLRLGHVASSNGGVHLTANGSILDGAYDSVVNVVASNAVLSAGAGIGEATNPLETGLAMLKANAGGGVWIVNTGPLEVGNVAAAGAVNIVALSPLTVSGVVLGASVTLEATETPDTGDDLTVQSGATITATTGPVTLIAGDDLVIEASSVIASGGDVFLIVGGNVQLSGTVLAHAMFIDGDDADNVIAITNLSTDTLVQTFGGNDTVHVGCNATLTSNTGGNVDAINARLVIYGGDTSGIDTLTIDDSGDNNSNSGILTDTMITGLGMGLGIEYYNIESLVVSLGMAGDTLTVGSTHAAATTINTGPGMDTVNIQTVSGPIAVSGGDDDDKVNVGSLAPATGGVVDGINALLTVMGDAGRDSLNVDDSGDTTSNNGTLTGSTLTGLGMGGSLQYAGIEALTIALGTGNDTFNVQGTSADTVTTLKTGAGDDAVVVSSTPPGNAGTLDGIMGVLNIDAGSGAHNVLTVSDAGDPDADTAVVITSSSISGLAPAIISYTATGGFLGGGIDISGGVGGNHVTIQSTRNDPSMVEVTQVNAGAGDDTVVITDSDPRYLVVHGQAGDDLLDGFVSPGGLTLFGDAGNDLLVGGAGSDVLVGDDGMVNFNGGVIHEIETVHRSEGGNDVLMGGAGEDVLIGGAGSDLIDGGDDRDLIFGDKALLVRNAGSGDAIDPRFRALSSTAIYDASGLAQVSGEFSPTMQPVPGGRPAWGDWTITLDPSLNAAQFGNDYLAGGAGNDEIFGQLGNDTIQGDGSIASRVDSDPATLPVSAARVNGLLQVVPSFESPTDGDDYIEGNGGDDVIFGNLGQDDIIGGSSSLFSLNTAGLRADGADLIFGGAGTDITRNNMGDETAPGHARDADMILGDNGNIYRLVSVNGTSSYRTFNYDIYNTLKIIPRAAQLLDYTPGGIDHSAAAANDIGAADEIHGESGDDFLYGQKGNDVLFGEAQDDDLIGGYGHDWISGGTGQDGVLGDDGRIFTSRHGTGEPLYGIAATTQVFMSTPGNAQQATINVTGELKKSVDLTPYNPDPMEYELFDPSQADDIIYGGLGGDFLHGESGDDGISAAEALPQYYDRPGNPGDSLAYNETTGEFALYDEYFPRTKISYADGAPFFLNFDPTEGPAITSPTWGTVNTDGDDKIFGDLGHDWLVGGTGRDNLYGGWGDDLLNVDDNLDTSGGLNNAPDTHPSYEDRAYGGAGRDRLIANTGGDRLIDWAGEFNSYLVPFAPFGMATVSRALQPQLAEFLYQLSASDGADPTRAADEGSDPARNGEPFGELGVMRQQDFAWRDQTGGPDDPQPGNIPGGPRDVLRSASFSDPQNALEGFAADSGTWTVQSGVLQVAADSQYGDAVAVYNHGEPLPAYFEVQASLQTIKPTGGWKANSYIIFDYNSRTDFKFAGIDVSINKLQIGHRDGSGWHVDKSTNVSVKPDKFYNALLSINGLNATIILDNNQTLTHTFTPRVVDGWSYGLNWGLVGMGSDNSRGAYDNIRIQVLPPEITFESLEDFADGVADRFTGEAIGAWAVSGGRYTAAPSIPASVSMLDLGPDHLSVDAVLELSTTVNTQGRAGFAFDRYSVDNFKFVAIDAEAGQVIIGHYTKKTGWVNDAVVAKVINAGTDYTLGMSLKGSTVSVTLNGQAVVGFAFNSVTVDGFFGLMASVGNASFDDVKMKTSDRVFAQPPGGSNLVAALAPVAPVGGASVTQSQLDGITAQAIGRWRESLGSGDARLSALGNFHISVADLPDLALGFTQSNRVLIDTDAAGHGWFIDGGATSGMDLLTVVMHELGHRLGFEHSEAEAHNLMGATLGVGERHLHEASGGDRMEEGSISPLPVQAPSLARDIGPLFGRGDDSPAGNLDEGGLIWESRLDSLFGWHRREGEILEPIASALQDGAGRLIDWSESEGSPERTEPVGVEAGPGQSSPPWLRRFLLELGEEDPNLAIEVTIPAEVA